MAKEHEPKALAKLDARVWVTVLAMVSLTSFFTSSSSQSTVTPPCGLVASALMLPLTVLPSRVSAKSAENPLKLSLQ